jgi:PQQ-like domain
MWNYAFNTGSTERISSPTPVIATGNTLYFSTSDGYLYALGPNTTTNTVTVSGSTVTNPYYCCTASTTAFENSPATSIFGLSVVEFSVIIVVVVVVAGLAAVFVIRSRRPRYRRAR